MKKTFLIWIFSVMASGLANAQIPSEAFPLTNSLYSLWHEGQTEKAIETTLKLYELYPPFLIDNFHNTLAQNFKHKNAVSYSSVYLEELRKRKNEAINKIVEPLYLWSKMIDNSDPVYLKSIFNDLSQVLSDSSNYESHTERYCLLALNEPNIQKLIDQKTREQLLLKVIRNLETYPYLMQEVKGGKKIDKRAWNRYLLSYSYFFLFSKFDQKEEYLMKASNYSPDETDLQGRRDFFYDAALLKGYLDPVGYRKDYLNYLKANHKEKESLTLLADITFCAPSDDNLKALKDYYAILSIEKPFKEYWHQYINQKCKSVPQLKIKFTEETLDLMQKSSHWVYIDVWGTWCVPCVEELPLLQEFFTKNQQNTNSVLKIYTFSFASQNLSSFMDKNRYNFPVSEIDKQANDAFEVTSYPTKILITPEGKYLKIPFNVDWRMYIKNYCLM